MAAYPAIPFALGIEPTIRDGVVVDRAMNGAGRGRNLFDAIKYALPLKHNAVSTANKDALVTFYNANRATGVVVTVTWVDGVTRNCILTGIKIVPRENLPSGRRWDVTITVEQV